MTTPIRYCEHCHAIMHQTELHVASNGKKVHRICATDYEEKLTNPILNDPNLPSLCDVDIKVGRLYRGKKPSKSLYGGIVGDRRVVWINSNRTLVSFLNTAFPESAPVTLSMHVFLKWVDHEVQE